MQLRCQGLHYIQTLFTNDLGGPQKDSRKL